MPKEKLRTMRYPPLQYDEKGKPVPWTQAEIAQWRQMNGIETEAETTNGALGMLGTLVGTYGIKAPAAALGVRLAQESGPLAKRIGDRLARLGERARVLRPVGELGRKLEQIQGMPATQEDALKQMGAEHLAWQDQVDKGINRIIRRANTENRIALGAGVTRSQSGFVARALLPARERAGQHDAQVSEEERMLADEYNAINSGREEFLEQKLQERHQRILAEIGDRYLRYLNAKEIEQIMGGRPIDTTEETPEARGQIIKAIQSKAERQGIPVLRLTREEAFWAAVFTGHWDPQIAFGKYGAEVKIENGRLILTMGQEESDIGPVDSVQVDIETPDGLEAARALQDDLVSFPGSRLVGGLIKRIMKDNEVVAPGVLFLGRTGADEQFPLPVLDGRVGRLILQAAINTFSELRERRKATIGPDTRQLAQMPERQFVQELKQEYRQQVHRLPRASAVRRLAARNRGRTTTSSRSEKGFGGQSNDLSARQRNFNEAARFLSLSDEQRQAYLQRRGLNLSVAQAVEGAKEVFWRDDQARMSLKVKLVRNGQGRLYRQIVERAQR